MSVFDPEDLAAFAKRANALESEMREIITSGKILRIKNGHQFLLLQAEIPADLIQLVLEQDSPHMGFDKILPFCIMPDPQPCV